MKSFAKLFLLLPLAFSMSLAGCKESKKSSETSEPTSSEVVPSSSEGESTSEEPVVEYTAAKVCEDFNANLTAAGYGSLAAEWDETYEEYSTGASFGASEDESEENLSDAAGTLASFLPEYMSLGFAVYGDPTSEDYYDLFEDGSIYFYASFVSPDESVEAAVISYVYSGYLCAQIGIYDVAK